MEAIYGLALTSASVLALLYAARIRNAPNASEWVKSGIVLQTVLFSTVIGFIFGLSMMFEFAANLPSAGFGAVEAGLLAAVAAASWFCWRAIKKMPTVQPTATIGTADDLPPAANNHGPQARTNRKVSGKAHKAA
jgi:hypothetical protein